MSLEGYHSVLVLGGIRSGKSEYAESLVAGVPDVHYVATAPAVPDDPEWSARLAAHRRRRPASWRTEETGAEPARLATLLSSARPGQTFLVDDLGGWLTQVLSETAGAVEEVEPWTVRAADAPVATLVEAVRDCAARLIIVSPEVGLSVVPATSVGRVFADALGSANQHLADACAAVVLVVAGQPSQLKPPAAPTAPPVGPTGKPAATMPATTMPATTVPATALPAAGEPAAGEFTPEAATAAQPTVPAAAADAAGVDSLSAPPPGPETDGWAAEPTIHLPYLIPVTDPRKQPAVDINDEDEPAEDDEPVPPAIEPGLTLPLPDDAAGLAASDRLATLDIPGAGLGRLAPVVVFAAAARGSATPRRFASIRVLLLHGRHQGGVAAGDSPTEWIRRITQAGLGVGPLGLLAAQAGARLDPIDLTGAQWPAARPIEDGDANTPAQVARAVRHGRQLADAAVDEGADLLVLAAGGPGQEAAAAAVVAAAGRAEPAALLRRVYQPGGRIDDNAWMVRCAAVRDAVHRSRGRHKDPLDVLASLGGLDIAVAVGVLIGAAIRRTPVLIDGPVGVAAGLVARDIAGQARLWLLLADGGDHPTVRAAAELLGLDRLVELGLSLGEGTSSLAALPLIQCALELASLDTVTTDTTGA